MSTLTAESEIVDATFVEENEAPTIVLSAPEPVPVIKLDQSASMVPIRAEVQSKLATRASKFVEEIDGLDLKSPEMDAKIAEINAVGAAEIAKSANVSNRMLDRPAMALQDDGNTVAQAKVSKTLGELRRTVTELTPNGADLDEKKVRKFLRLLPGSSKIDSRMDRFKTAGDELKAITAALAAGQAELRADNVDIEKERNNLWELMGSLTEYASMLGSLDSSLDGRILELESGDKDETKRAEVMRSDVQFAVRQRRQDLLAQLAVSAQGYLAMDLIKKSNVELEKGVERAKTTTLAALRTGVIGSQALESQKRVLGQIDSLNATTNEVIANNAAMLRSQSTEIQQRATSSTVDIAKLERAFEDVFATMDQIDTFRGEAVAEMRQAVDSLQAQVERAEDYVKRSHKDEDA